MNFVLWSQATPAAALFAQLTPAALKEIAQAITIQLNRDLSPCWGGDYAMRVGAGPGDLTAGEVSCAILDTLPVAGAVADHGVDPNAVPVIEIGLTDCDGILSGSTPLSGAASHEALETAVDKFCNGWRDDGAGFEWAQEACDAVQEWTYAIGGVPVSDFVTPEFFGPGSVGPYNFLGIPGQTAGSALALPAPFSTAPGGYQVRRVSGTGEVQVTGMIAAHRRARKRHPSSRTYRRGARV